MRSAQRRHHDRRVLRRRLTQPSHWWIVRDERFDDTARARWMGIIRNTGTTCSCMGCRVNRRHYGPSVQEKRQIQFMEEMQ